MIRNNNVFSAFNTGRYKQIKKEYAQNPIRTKVKERKQDKSNLLLLSLATLGIATLAGIIYVKKSRASQAENASNFILDLANSLSEKLNKKITTDNLSSIMTKDEFLSATKKLSKENYIANKENIEKGIFCADVHSHSNFSDGEGSVENILEQVSSYANKLYEKTKQKFIFALTDHDTINGTKQALEIISQNPEKFKNVKFVIGSEISYLLKSPKTTNPCETQELLVYGFNPFSKEVESFFENISIKRKLMRENYIKDLAEMFPETKFSEEEFLNIFLKDKISRNQTMNSFWQIYHYGQVKKVLSDTAKAKNLNPEEYFKETISKAPMKINLHTLKQHGLVENWINENPRINIINNKYRPSINQDGTINQTCENLLTDIKRAFEKENDCTIGFAHPFYISERTDDVQGTIKLVKDILGKKLTFTESYHQAYNPQLLNTKNNEILAINDFCEKQNLIPIGGRDNHNKNWLTN